MPICHYQANFTAKTYTKYDEGTALLNVHAGAGYNLQQEVQWGIHLNLGKEPLLPALMEARVENHIMGVVFAHQYTLKKGLEIFGDRAEEATTKEIK